MRSTHVRLAEVFLYDIDVNVFKGVFTNMTFMTIFIATVVMQIILVQFGGNVFQVYEHGLTALQWAISVLLGGGSMVVGLLVRILPPFPIPAFLTADYITSTPMDESDITLDIKEDAPTSIARLPSRELWKRAVHKTQVQMRVVRAFQDPSPRSSLGSSTSRPERAALPMLTPGTTRRESDQSNIVIVNPRLVKAAKIRAAQENRSS
jgi:hypothetical protein